MLSSLKNLHSIVTEMEKIIDHDINVTDNRGIIIASTDRLRIGQFHEPAARVLHRLRDQKQKMQLESANRDELKKRMADMSTFLKKQSTALTEY
ncbi:MAG: hypothetical protein GXY67_06470, partial [Clostridiales bacterium]|nr:hypothetical protein [Clostridiales bacterium]